MLPLGGGENEDAPVLVKKGTIVAYHLYVMHRRKDLFGEDADVFRPERWIDGEGGGEDGKGLRVGWEFLPFNGGPRICIGREFISLFPPLFLSCIWYYDESECSVLTYIFFKKRTIRPDGNGICDRTIATRIQQHGEQGS